MRCLTCYYDLRKLKEHRCPECGRGFVPGNPATWTAQTKPYRRLVVLAYSAAVIIATFLCVAVAILFIACLEIGAHLLAR